MLVQSEMEKLINDGGENGNWKLIFNTQNGPFCSEFVSLKELWNVSLRNIRNVTEIGQVCSNVQDFLKVAWTPCVTYCFIQSSKQWTCKNVTCTISHVWATENKRRKEPMGIKKLLVFFPSISYASIYCFIIFSDI